MDDAAAGQGHSPDRITVLYAAVSATQQLRGLGHVLAVQATVKGLDVILGIAAESGGDVVRKADDSMLACFADPVEAVKAAIRMQKGTAGDKRGATSLAVRIALHCGRGSFRDGAIHGDIAVFAADATHIARAGHIYVSSAVYQGIGALKAVEFHPVDIPGSILSGRSSFYEIVWHPETDCAPGFPLRARCDTGGAPTVFSHGAALLKGKHPPCFYCGTGKHLTTYCPSKHLPYGARGLERLGHFSEGEINDLFSRYLGEAGEDLPAPVEASMENPTYLAPWSFYELKRSFQLRFLNVIWSASPKDDWHRVKEGKRETSAEGGILWLARDCIRASDLDEAENLLARYGRQNSRDYRTACALGFVKIERGEYRAAGDFFREALSRETSPAQKTYICLLLSRICEFINSPGKSLDALKEALRIEPYCLEARFEDAVRHFRLKRQPEAVNRLVKLLQLSHEFYVPVLISPELSEFRSLIAPELDKLAGQVQKDAQKASKEADDAAAVLTGLADRDDADVAEILSMREHLHRLMEKPEAFLGCHEAFHVAKRITAACSAIEQERRDDVAKVLQGLRGRAATLLQGRVGAGRIEPRLRPILERLKIIGEELDRREPFARCIGQCGELSRELDSAEASAIRWRRHAELLHACGTFLKDSVFVLFVTAVTGLVLFPGVFYCLGALHAGSMLSSVELRQAQKSVLIVGGAFAVVFALGRAAIGRPKTDGGIESK